MCVELRLHSIFIIIIIICCFLIITFSIQYFCYYCCSCICVYECLFSQYERKRKPSRRKKIENQKYLYLYGICWMWCTILMYLFHLFYYYCHYNFWVLLIHLMGFSADFLSRSRSLRIAGFLFHTFIFFVFRNYQHFIVQLVVSNLFYIYTNCSQQYSVCFLLIIFVWMFFSMFFFAFT